MSFSHCGQESGGGGGVCLKREGEREGEGKGGWGRGIGRERKRERFEPIGNEMQKYRIETSSGKTPKNLTICY